MVLLFSLLRTICPVVLNILSLNVLFSKPLIFILSLLGFGYILIPLDKILSEEAVVEFTSLSQIPLPNVAALILPIPY